jgi:hypothetical protein
MAAAWLSGKALMYPCRIGQNVIRAVELLEQIGQVSVSVGRPQKNERPSIDARALRRAVQYGLATRSQTAPYVYRPSYEWRDVLKRTEWAPIAGRVASVWDLAN